MCCGTRYCTESAKELLGRGYSGFGHMLTPHSQSPSLPLRPSLHLKLVRPLPLPLHPILTPPSVLIFIITILLLAADFYYLKNIAGRRLVGLRWWNEVDTQTGSSQWVFESSDPAVKIINATDSRFFWMALYVQPLLWIALAILAVVKLEFIWLTLVGESCLPPACAGVGFGGGGSWDGRRTRMNADQGQLSRSSSQSRIPSPSPAATSSATPRTSQAARCTPAAWRGTWRAGW